MYKNGIHQSNITFLPKSATGESHLAHLQVKKIYVTASTPPRKLLSHDIETLEDDVQNLPLL